MAAPKLSVERAARPIGWNRAMLVSVPRRTPIEASLLTSPMAHQRAKSSSVETRMRVCSKRFCGSPALRSTADTRTPASSNRRRRLPGTRKCLTIVLLSFQRSHVDGEAILHIRLEESFVRLIDLLDRDHFYVGGDVVLPAEVQHLLRLCDASDRGAGDAAPPSKQTKGS